MPQLTIVIPATNSQAALDSTLLSVLENRPHDCHVVIPHPRSYVDPYGLDDEVEFVEVDSDDLAALMHAGISASRAEIVHLLLPGMRVTEGWTAPALARFAAQPTLAAAACAVMDAGDPSRLLTAGLCYRPGGGKKYSRRTRRAGRSRQRRLVDGPNLLAAFLRRQDYLRVGPLSGQFGPYHIDTDLAARLRREKLVCEPISDCRVLADALPSSPRGFLAGRRAEQLFWEHADLYPRLLALAAHLPLVTGDLLSQLPSPQILLSALGRGWGWIRSRRSPSGAANDPPRPVISIAEEQQRRDRTRRDDDDSQTYSRSA